MQHKNGQGEGFRAGFYTGYEGWEVRRGNISQAD